MRFLYWGHGVSSETANIPVALSFLLILQFLSILMSECILFSSQYIPLLVTLSSVKILIFFQEEGFVRLICLIYERFQSVTNMLIYEETSGNGYMHYCFLMLGLPM